MKMHTSPKSRYLNMELHSVKIEFNQEVLDMIICMCEERDDDAEVVTFAIEKTVSTWWLFRKTKKPT